MLTATPSLSLARDARPKTARPGIASDGNSDSGGVGGCAIAALLGTHAPQLYTGLGVIVEQLDMRTGTWQYSLDGGRQWHTVRTDILNRPAPMGLALDGAARLRVLPYVGSAHGPARIVLHAAQCAVGAGNGCFGAYAAEGRPAGARSVTLVLPLATINGTPTGTPAPRPRNKRALAAQRSLS